MPSTQTPIIQKGANQMGKQKSLFYQFESSINDTACFKKHIDKHSQKSQTEQKEQPWRIYSFSARSNLLDTAHSLSGYIKEHYDIKQVKAITADMCQSWLDHCAKNGCSISTLETYKSNLTKLSHVVNKHFGLHTDFSTTVKGDLVIDKTSPREFALSQEEIDEVKRSIVKPCNSSNFFLFSSFCATRVNTVEKLMCRDVSFGKNYEVGIRILGDKGNRDRSFTIQDKEFYKLCRSLVSNKSPDDLVFGGIKKGSADRWLNRRLHKLNITVPMDKTIGSKRIMKSGNHSVRKAAIQEYYRKQYDYYIKHGYSPIESKKLAQGDACVRLGHSRDRFDVISCYLG